MTRISPERKSAALAKLLPPYNMTVTAVAQMEGISEATLYNWRNQAKAEGKPLPGADKTTEQWPAKPYWPSLLKPPCSVRPRWLNTAVKNDCILNKSDSKNRLFYKCPLAMTKPR
ncbi:transposase [Xenorhabdus bovienii]|uniref:transposase n=1 Tax=Xenorhabdus bovienii TaxID=40576 RepID=UPI003DA1DB98